jgi:predicted ATP-grasp superfamily ATP-dependent carboligase
VDRKSVLILDGDSRQGLPFMRALRGAGHHVTVVCPWRACPGYLSRYANRRLLWPAADKDERAFLAALMRYVQSTACDVVLPLGDVTAGIVSRNKVELCAHTATPIPDYEVFIRAADKWRTMKYCMDNAIPCPLTVDGDATDLDAVLQRIPFPVIVKPTQATGAVGLYRFDTLEDLRVHLPSVRARHGPVIIQEVIPAGSGQYHAMAFCNAESDLAACVVVAKPRYFPVSGGTGTCVVTVDRPDASELVRSLLRGIRWTGAADVDLLLDPRDGQLKVLEINPRVPVSIKIAFDAATDYADLHIRLALQQEVPERLEYQAGRVLRNLCLDLAWYVCSGPAARAATEPPFWDFFGANTSYQTFCRDDFLPLLGFVLSNLRKYCRREAWAAKMRGRAND